MKNLLPRDVTLTVIYHSERFCLEEPKRAYCEGSLTYVRDDKRCHSDDRKEEESLPKNEERDSSYMFGMTIM